MARFAADEMLELRSSAARKSEELFRKSVADQRADTEGLQVDNIEWKQDGRTWLCTFDLSVVRNDGEVLTPVKRSIRLVLEEGQWKVEDAQ